jgi:hypothetical protein
MFQQLYELSQCLPTREAWEQLNEGMSPIYDRGLAVFLQQEFTREMQK